MRMPATPRRSTRRPTRSDARRRCGMSGSCGWKNAGHHDIKIIHHEVTENTKLTKILL
jgi:hypothetical protein